MSLSIAAAPTFVRPMRRFILTPKGLLLVILAGVTALAASQAGFDLVAPGLAAAVGTAALTDIALSRVTRGSLIFPSGALLTGLIVALVLSPTEPWPIAACTAGIAIASKYLFRTRLANVFNPAAFALVLAPILFASGESWWGALPDLGPIGIAVLLVTGVFIADRVNKLPLVLVFLGAYFGAFTAASFLVEPAQVAEIFRTPDLQAGLFFALFMLDDPPTCPVRYGDQVVFGVIVASSAYFAFMAWGLLYFLPAGLLVGNAFEGWRRWSAARSRVRPATA